LYENENINNDIRATAAVSRCAANSDTLKQPEVDKHGMKTTWDVPPVVENLLKYLNSPEMQGEFSYGCKAVLCEDETKCLKRQDDMAFLAK
jgi:hypothetical protein